MDSDNLYPNDYSLLHEDADLTRAREQEETEVFKELPILEKTIRSLRKAIKFYKTIDSISPEILTNPDEFMHVIAGNQIAVDVMSREVEELELLVKEYLKEE